MVLFASLVAVVRLALVHLFSGRLPIEGFAPRSGWLSLTIRSRRTSTHPQTSLGSLPTFGVCWVSFFCERGRAFLWIGSGLKLAEPAFAAKS
jgi:hypothetical protein